MKALQVSRIPLILIMAVTLLGLPLLISGCAKNTSGTTETEFGTSLVPSVDLDFYVYIDQQVPTVIPKSLTGAPADISVQSLAIWGITNNDSQFAVAGALNFDNSAEAGAVFTQIPVSANNYTKLSDQTIYFLKGSGGPAESLKNAIFHNDFKQFDDKNALKEVAKLPSGGTTIPILIGIVKPKSAAINFVKLYLDQNTADTVDTLFSYGKPKIIALGVFSSQPLSLAKITERISDNTVWDMDLGAVVSMDSIYPGPIFSQVTARVIANQGFPEAMVGNLTAYVDSVNIENGKTIPTYLNISGNHLYATASGRDSYAQTLLTSIKR
jgi:hypothetical protein